MAVKNPLRMIRNSVARFRTMGEDVSHLRGEVSELRATLEDLRARLDDLTQEAHSGRRSAEMAARRQGLRRERVRVVVLVHNTTVWGSLAELVDLMTRAEDFDPVVVSIPHDYDRRRGQQHGESEVHALLQSAGVEHLRVRETQLDSAAELLRALDPDIVVRQSQWDADVDGAFSTASLAWVRLVLVPYEMANIVQVEVQGDPPVDPAVDLPFHRAAWLVFVASELSLQGAREASLVGGRQFRAVGHPKADALRRTEPLWPLPAAGALTVGGALPGVGVLPDTGSLPAAGARPPTAQRRRRVLWSATHSFMTGWHDFGMFPWTKDAMLEWAQEDAGTDFVFIHHPHFPTTVARADSPVTAEEYRAWESRWQALPNATVHHGHYAEVLAATDVVVTDGLSMMCEPQVLATPVFFLEREGHAPFNRVGEQFLTGVHRCEDVAAVRRGVEALWARGGDDLRQAQAHNVQLLLGEPGAAVRILAEIREQVARDRGGDGR